MTVRLCYGPEFKRIVEFVKACDLEPSMSQVLQSKIGGDEVISTRHVDLDGQRSSIAFINSSAQRTASEMAATVAGTLFPPSNGDNFRAARIAAAIKMTRLRPSSTSREYHVRLLFATAKGSPHLGVREHLVAGRMTRHDDFVTMDADAENVRSFLMKRTGLVSSRRLDCDTYVMCNFVV
jgi:hypothetical protein